MTGSWRTRWSWPSTTRPMSPPRSPATPTCSSSIKRDQFLANREAGEFAGYPEPDAMLGEALIADMARPSGRVLVSHLGVGLADVVFGRAILEAAVERWARHDRAR